MECGTDIIEISRIKESVKAHGEAFLSRIFTADEIGYCESKKNVKYQHYAARFTAKEAVAKAFGTGFNGKFDWKEIEVKNDDFGKPEVILSGKALEFFNASGSKSISISMAHCKEYATSVVICY